MSVTTVGELIKMLKKFPPDRLLAVPLHSEYMDEVDVAEVELYDNGGYLSHPYRVSDSARVKTYVLIS
jgi:hypothetical protein